MAVRISSDHNNVISWSYTETTTPSAPGDAIAGGGALNLTLKYKRDEEFLQGETIQFQLPESLGQLEGWVRTSSFMGSEGFELEADLNIPTLMTALSVNRIVPLVMDETLENVIRAYLSTVFDVVPPIVYTASNVELYSFIGWEGNVWDGLCSLAAMANVEITTDGSSILVRDLGSNIIELGNTTTPVLSFQENNVGRYLDIAYTNQHNVESIGNLITNLTTNPSLETNTTGWSVTNDTTPGIVNTDGRTTAWSAVGEQSMYHTQTVTNYSTGTLRINTPWVAITGGQQLKLSVAAYIDTNRMQAFNYNTYTAYYEIRNSGGTVIQTGTPVNVSRGSRAAFVLPTTPVAGTSARIVLKKDWEWNG